MDFLANLDITATARTEDIPLWIIMATGATVDMEGTVKDMEEDTVTPVVGSITRNTG